MTLAQRRRTDITPGSVAALGESVMQQRIEMLVPRTQVMARGWIDPLLVTPHLAVLRGDLSGLRPFAAEVDGHPGLTLELRLAGESRSSEAATGREFSLRAGDWLVVGSPGPSTWLVNAPAQPGFRTVSVHVMAEGLPRLAATDRAAAATLRAAIAGRTLRSGRMSAALLQLALTLFHLDQAPPAAALRAEGLALAALADILPLLGGAGPEAAARPAATGLAELALRRVAERPTLDLTPAALADACAVSLSTLNRALRAECGTSAFAVIRRAALGAALRLLRDGVPVAEAARAVGYASPEALAKACRQEYGLPPSGLIRPS
ncbi:helix-turn-helix domain-containing protein [Rhodobacter calidifons]|uniref:Helix-turn-helix domain-containing protein n=1 Tax=Rhodobacter calidifons TaxID=2715277 RepID=A0ABX0G9G2_9RHOB|nr:helix-turn-helix domain-containing protein [Rhodobacter calidifons]NHB77508.1 helix-turn-helix domain-containing protein [Rhodobacter calidifons]